MLGFFRRRFFLMWRMLLLWSWLCGAVRWLRVTGHCGGRTRLLGRRLARLLALQRRVPLEVSDRPVPACLHAAPLALVHVELEDL